MRSFRNLVSPGNVSEISARLKSWVAVFPKAKFQCEGAGVRGVRQYMSNTRRCETNQHAVDREDTLRQGYGDNISSYALTLMPCVLRK